jgi:hypothetical protein
MKMLSLMLMMLPTGLLAAQAPAAQTRPAAAQPAIRFEDAYG